MTVVFLAAVYAWVLLGEAMGAVQMMGAAVVLTGIARISVLSNGKPNSFGVRFTDVYANDGGKWQMVSWQSTKLPE